jgi:hypothetical protein
MSLSFYYEFSAPGTTTAEELEGFLHEVEKLARSLGFNPTTVLNVPFDTKERRDFARRLGGSFTLQDDKLKGVALPLESHVRNYDPVSGECRLIPEYGVLLVVTDEQECETCFGFFKFPTDIPDIHGKSITKTGFNDSWVYRDFVDSPDPRFRQIVKQFEIAGYLKFAKDEFAG